MRISITVKANSKENSVQKSRDNEFTVRVKARAKEGKANDAVIGVLSAHFGVAKSRVDIIRGHTAKKKIVDIS
ncbi:MAG: DUF167 domain-containing protein [Candidatus Omnitrophica bacterium]|nr:DUF167 domain-containing protein [Candidatus Omnitrophota bacterium]MDD5655619.1 DUF167 domain-containing protein [Candidatus Omnitrophota bacterium]